MVKRNSAQRDHSRHSGDSAHEKIKRNFPGPDGWFHHSLPVVTGFARNRTARNINTFARDDSVFPRLLAQFFQSFLGCHEKNANAASVATIDAIAVANAAIQADFK